MKTLDLFLAGAIMMQCIVISLFFLRFKKKSGDPFFSRFAACFALLAVERVVWFASVVSTEYRPLVYLMRLCGYLIIVAAVLGKNRRLSER